MNNVFSGTTAAEVWSKAITKLQATSLTQEGRNGSTKELLHSSFRITNPRERWVLNRLPAMNPAFAIAEVFWIISGDNSSSFINYWNNSFQEYAGKGATYYGAYGYRIRKQFDFDQLDNAYNALNMNPHTRQVVIQIWDPKYDLPDSNGQPRNADIPCNICSIPKVREGKLEWLQVMRSNDIYLGTPHNFIQFTSLQEILAGWLGLEVGSYHHISDSLHLYEKNFNAVSLETSLTFPSNNDDLRLPKDEFSQHLKILMPKLHKLTCDSLTHTDFRRITSSAELYPAYRNLLEICAAESARRRGWQNEVQTAYDLCTNKLLKLAFSRWHHRMNSNFKKAAS